VTGRRTRGREAALQILYFWEVGRAQPSSAIEAYFAEHDLPRHPLEAQGYLSVGCQPCTSKVAPGEDARAGRWRGWDKTECGIHGVPEATPDGDLPPGYEPAF